MQPSPPTIPSEMACGQIDSELKQPTVLPGGNINDLPKPRTDKAHDPVPDFPLTVLPGGNVNDVSAPRTDTAHDPAPDFSQQLPGCGGL